MTSDDLTHVGLSAMGLVSMLVAVISWLGKRNIGVLDATLKELKQSGEHLEAMLEDARREMVALREQISGDRNLLSFKLGAHEASLAKLDVRITEAAAFWRSELKDHIARCHP